MISLPAGIFKTAFTIQCIIRYPTPDTRISVISVKIATRTIKINCVDGVYKVILCRLQKVHVLKIDLNL